MFQRGVVAPKALLSCCCRCREGESYWYLYPYTPYGVPGQPASQPSVPTEGFQQVDALRVGLWPALHLTCDRGRPAAKPTGIPECGGGSGSPSKSRVAWPIKSVGIVASRPDSSPTGVRKQAVKKRACVCAYMRELALRVPNPTSCLVVVELNKGGLFV